MPYARTREAIGRNSNPKRRRLGSSSCYEVVVKTYTPVVHYTINLTFSVEIDTNPQPISKPNPDRTSYRHRCRK